MIIDPPLHVLDHAREHARYAHGAFGATQAGSIRFCIYGMHDARHPIDHETHG